MREALKEAAKAYKKEEVPIGAVIVKDNKIIGRGYNRIEATSNSTAHAEILAIKKASRKIGGWRLSGCSLYVTVEPCLMCLGAAMLARVSDIIYGAPEPSFGSVDKLLKLPKNINIRSGVLEEECKEIIKKFFKRLRK